MILRTWFPPLLLIASLSGCSTSTSTIIESLQYVWRGDSTFANARLNPDFRYLRATIDGRTALLVLGYVDSHPQGPVQVWYSAEREVLRLQNGRIVGATGLTTEWRSVTLPALPSWAVLACAEGASRWVRVRDVMPGYRYAVHDTLALRVSSPPKKTALQNLDPQELTWFEERIEPDAVGGLIAQKNELPPARYAVSFGNDVESVVYGEQCLAPDLCFSWQVWPAASPNPNKAK